MLITTNAATGDHVSLERRYTSEKKFLKRILLHRKLRPMNIQATRILFDFRNRSVNKKIKI